LEYKEETEHACWQQMIFLLAGNRRPGDPGVIGGIKHRDPTGRTDNAHPKQGVDRLGKANIMGKHG